MAGKIKKKMKLTENVTVNQQELRRRVRKVRKIRKTQFDENKLISIQENETVAEKKTRHRLEEEILRVCLSESMTREEIASAMGLGIHEVEIIESRLLAKDGQRFLTMSTAHRYYLYCLQQGKNVSDLDAISNIILEEYETWKKNNERMVKRGMPLTKGVSRPPLQALIMAIKAKSSIADQVLKTGQDMGIIERRAKEVRYSGQINLAAMSTDKLKKLLDNRLKTMQQLVDKGTLPPVYTQILESRKN